MSKILIVGDSISAKCGFDDPAGKVWYHNFPKLYNITNLSIDGSSNQTILQNTAYELCLNQYDIIIVQWSGLFRLNLYDATNIYSNQVNLTVGEYNSFFSKQSKYSKFAEFWRKTFLHGRMEILTFLKQVSILGKMVSNIPSKIIFIKTFSNFLDDCKLPNWKDCSTNYHNFILNMSDYPDQELDKIHLEIHTMYKKMQEITNSMWLNLDSLSWKEQQIDFSNDLSHPGIQTSEIYYKQVYNLIKTVIK